MNNDVLPTFQAHDAKIETVLSDNGPGVLRPARPASLRAVPAARGHLPPHHTGEAAAVQRHRRTATPHPARRALPGRGPPHLVRNHRRNADSSRRLPGRLQSAQAAPGPRHERPHARPRLRRRLAYFTAKEGGKESRKTSRQSGRRRCPLPAALSVPITLSVQMEQLYTRIPHQSRDNRHHYDFRPAIYFQSRNCVIMIC